MNVFSKIKLRLLKIARRRKANGDFVRRRRYRVEVVNTSSLSALASFTMSRTKLILAAVGAFLAVGVLWYILLTLTPLRGLMPGRLDTQERDRFLEMSVKLDSIASTASVNDQYAANLLAILNDSLPVAPEISAQMIPDIQDIPLDSLMQASDAERRFVNSFEDAERFNLSVLSPIAGEGMTFYSPVTGLNVEPKIEEGDIPAVMIPAGKATPVSAIYRGTVVSTYFTTRNGITVVIQHPNDFLSQYSGLSEIFVKRGDKVNAGTRIGIASGDKYPLTFELWHNGSALDATEYIGF